MLDLDLQFFAKLTASFNAKGELDMDKVVIYEVKNRGKDDEYIEVVDLLGFMKEFHGQEVSITIKRDEEVYRVDKEELGEPNTTENKE